MRLPPRDLKGRIYLALIMIGVAPLLLGAIILLQTAEHKLESAAMSRLELIARERTLSVQHWLDNKQAHAGAIATNKAVLDCVQGSRQRLAPACAALPDLHLLAGINDLLLFDADGRLLTSQRQILPAGRIAEGEWAQALQSARHSGQRHLIHHVPYPAPEYVAMVIAPLYDAGVPVGTLALQLDPHYLADLLGGRLDDLVEIVVGRRQGDGMVIMTASSPVAAKHPPEATLSWALAGQTGVGRADGPNGQAVLAAWRPIGISGLGLVARMPLDVALSTIQQLRMIAVAVLLLVTLLALSVGWMIARRLDRPLADLIRFGEKLPDNLALRTTHTGDDEFGRLGRTLNQMAQALEQAQLGLLELKQGLEGRIAERSADLHSTLRLLSQAEILAGFGSWERDADGQLYWSDGVFRLLGLPPPPVANGELQRRPVGPADLSRLDPRHAGCCSAADTYVLEYDVQLANGQVKWLTEHGTTERDATGRTLRCYGTLQDMTTVTQERRQRAAAEDNAHNIVAHATEGIVVVQPDSRKIVFMNDAALRIFGRSAEECIGHAFFMLFPYSLWPQMDEHWLQLARDKNLILAGVNCQRQDGSMFEADVSLFQLVYSGTECYAGFFRDISYRSDLHDAQVRAAKAEEDALLLMIQLTAQQAVERADLILSSLSDGVIGISRTGRISFCNDAATNMLEVSGAELLGQMLGDVLVHFDDEGQPVAMADDPLLNFQNGDERIFSNEEWFAGARGPRFAVEYSGQPSPQASEDLAGVLVFRNINQRRSLDERLRQMSQAVEHSGSSVIITNRQGELVYVNPKFCQVSGYTTDEVLGRNPRFLKSGATPRESYTEMWQTIQAGREWRGQMLNRRKDGSLWWESISITALKNRRGEITHYVAVHEDITEQKALAEGLQRAKTAAEAAAEAKGAFLANISHEIRTPMNAILGFARLAMRGNLPGTTRDQLQKMQAAADGLLEILNDVLDFSKIESGNMSVEHIEFSLESVLNRFTDLVQLRLDEKPVQLTVVVAPSVPRHLLGDPLRLGQILANLGTNAAKFTSAGEIRLTIQGQVAHDGGFDLECAVHDSGIGMTDEQVRRLFTPFHQADTSTTRQYGGTGLGLAISQQLAGLMGGDIRVTSTAGHGSTFTLRVHLGIGSGASTIISSVDGQRLLLVDDDLQSRVMMRQVAAELGWEVTTVSRADEALQELRDGIKRAEPYAVVLMDWVMPEMDGIECIQQIRREFAEPDQPLPVLITGFGLQELQYEMRRNSLECPVLTKPLLAEALAEVLKGIATTHRDQPQPSGHLRGRTILVVDDYPFNQEIIQGYLTPTGATILQAGHGVEALQILQQQPVDLVFMDCQMPVMDGYETTRRIRQNPAWQHLPVIALTANATAGQRDVVLAAGMNDYLTKPVAPEQLLASLAEYLQTETTTMTQTQPPQSTPTPADTLPEIPGMDLEAALKRAMNRPELLSKYLKMFRQSEEGFAAAFDAAWQDGDIVTAQRLAHTLKSGAAAVGFTALSILAADLETACREQAEPSRLLAIAAQTKDELARILARLV